MGDKSMDWPTIISSILGTAGVIGGLGLLLRKSIDKLLEVRLSEIKAVQKAEISEAFRRQAAVFDMQFDALKTAASLAYRARNVARQIRETPHLLRAGQKGAGQPPTSRDILAALKAYHLALEELLFEEVGLLPSRSFALLHDQKCRTQAFLSVAEQLSRALSDDEPPMGELERIQKRLDVAFSNLEEGFEKTVANSRLSLGTENSN